MTHPALEFLNYLDGRPEARFNIECYTDVPKGISKPKPDPLLHRWPDLLIKDVGEILPQLDALNASGAGIFVARNECIGQRCAESVSRVRGIHADMDEVTQLQLDELFTRLPPSFVVQTSSPSRVQVYWQLEARETLSPDEAKALNQSLKGYGADPAAVDAARLLRLPGFRHMKYREEGLTPFVTATFFDREYSADALRTAFPAKAPPPKPVTRIRTSNVSSGASEMPAEWARIAGTVSQRHKVLWEGDWSDVERRNGEVGYPSQSEADLALAGAIARTCVRGGVKEAELFEATEAIFGLSGLASSDKWQDRPDYRERTITKALSSLDQPQTQLVLPPEDALFSPQPKLTLESEGDIRNAIALAQLARDNFVYLTNRDRWLRWSDERWQVCDKDEHIAMGKEAAQRILLSASAVLATNQERGKKLVSDAVAAHNLNKIQAMLKLAVSEPGMSVTERELDANPYLLGVANGVVDLRTGLLMANEPSLYITRYCAAEYVEGAQCPRWSRFVDEVFLGDKATIKAVQLLLGYTLTGLNTEERLVICYGHGSNGKSVFSNVILTLLGGYGMTAPSSILVTRRSGDAGPRNDLAALAGSRLVSINELQAGDRLDEQVVKMLAGREPIPARFLFKEWFEYIPQFTPWMRTNHKPIITGDDDGIWRRLILLPFKRSFKDEEKDPHLEQKLLAELPGILQWAIEGARLYLKDGLQLSPQISAEVATYRQESDLLGEFLVDCTIEGPTERVEQKHLFNQFQCWRGENGLHPTSKRTFTQRLIERGFSEAKSGAKRFYLGLKLSEGAEPKPSPF